MPVEWEYHWSPSVTPESLAAVIRMHTGEKCEVLSVGPDEFVLRFELRARFEAVGAHLLPVIEAAAKAVPAPVGFRTKAYPTIEQEFDMYADEAIFTITRRFYKEPAND